MRSLPRTRVKEETTSHVDCSRCHGFEPVQMPNIWMIGSWAPLPQACATMGDYIGSDNEGHSVLTWISLHHCFFRELLDKCHLGQSNAHRRHTTARPRMSCIQMKMPGLRLHLRSCDMKFSKTIRTPKSYLRIWSG